MRHPEVRAHPHTLADEVGGSWLAQLPDGAFLLRPTGIELASQALADIVGYLLVTMVTRQLGGSLEIQGQTGDVAMTVHFPYGNPRSPDTAGEVE